MPLYLNTITNEHEEINYSAVDYYLMRLDDNKFLFMVSEKNMIDHLNVHDIPGTMKKFWMLTHEQVQTNLALLFPSNMARSSALTLQEVNTIQGLDLDQQEIEEFIKVRMEVYSIEKTSRDPQNHKRLHDLNFINALINILSTSTDVLTLNYAIRSIVNLTPTYMQIIRRKFCIQKLFTLLDHQHYRTQKYAILALTIIYQENIIHPDELRNVHDNPIFLHILLKLIRSTFHEIQKHALVILSRMSSYIETHAYMSNPDVIRYIVDQLRSLNNEYTKYIHKVFCNLSIAQASHKSLRDCNVIPILLDSVLHSPSHHIKEKSARALLHLSKNINNQEIILAHNGADICVSLSKLSGINTLISELAICTLINLSINSDNELLQPDESAHSMSARMR